jgi:hypothetical protein
VWRFRDQLFSVVMADLVAEMSQQGAIALAQFQARLLAKRGIGFGNVDGNQAVLMADVDSLSARFILLERER